MLRFTRPSGRGLRRLVLFTVPLLAVVSTTPTLGAFTAAITGNGTGTAGSLVLTATPTGGTACTSTGGSNTPFTSDSASCAGNVLSSSELSSSSAGSLATSFTTAGTIAPSSASLVSAAAGTEVAPDASGSGDDGFPLDGVTFGASGPLAGGAASLSGSTSMLETQQEVNDPGPSFTLAAWFKVSSGYSSGGGIIAFQSSQGGAPADADRKLWMDDSGHICAGEYAGSEQIATSSGTYNNGAWHLAVASFSSTSGLTLYVDGTSVGTNSGATAPQNYAGYWTLGYSYYSGAGWPPQPASEYLAGSLAEVAVFPSALSSAAVSTLYGGGSGSESSFETRVQADSPSQFWPLQSPSTTTNLPTIASLPDISANNNLGTPEGGVSQVDTGPLSGSGSMYFDGASNADVETTIDNAALPSSFTITAWFKAPSGLSTGGGILTLDSSQAGGGAHHDPLLWMNNAGEIVAGTYPSGGPDEAATSPSAYNNGSWHFVAATVSSAGLKLYVDGSLVATNTSGTGGGTVGGYWLIGYLDGTTWSGTPTDDYWTGDLANAAYLPSALSAGQITTLYGEASTSAFETQLLADAPTYYWPLINSGTTATEGYPFFQVVPDYSGENDDATAIGSTVTLGAPGKYASSFAGALTGGSGYLQTASLLAGPDTFSLVAWFKAPSHATGGVIFDFDNTQSSSGVEHDRSIWMDNAGKLVAGISGGGGVEVTSPSTYDNGAWHLVVASFTSSSLTLYVDSSTAVASTSSGITDANYNGYWTIGYGDTSNWADVPSDAYWDGELADAAVIPSAVSSSTVATMLGEASQSAFTSELLSLSPTAYWTLGDPASSSTEAGAVELSLQAANSGTTTCLFPGVAGTCPALGESDLTPQASSWAASAPTASHATTLTLAGEEATAAPAGFVGLHFVLPLTLSGTASSWTASLGYADANFDL